MKNVNKTKGNANTNTFLEIKNSKVNIDNVFINQSNTTALGSRGDFEKIRVIETNINNFVALAIAVIAFFADLSTLILNFAQFDFLKSSLGKSVYVFQISTAIISILVILATNELRRKRFSTLVPGTSLQFDYVLTLDENNSINIERIKQKCPNCSSSMKVGIKIDSYYLRCKRNSDHDLKFDYTKL